MSRKRRREVYNVDAKDVEIYEDLANEDEGIRLKAAQRLLSKLSPENSPRPEQLEKYLKRLIRGLCSGRKAARIGFSVALTEVLIQHVTPETDGEKNGLKVSEVVDLLLQLTRLGGGVSGQEERDHHLGKLFGAEAIVMSKILFASHPDTESWERVLDIVFELAKKKTWIREECGWLLFRAIQSLEPLANGQTYSQFIIDKLESQGLIKTPEGVALWIVAEERFPNMSLPKHVFQHQDPLHRKEMVGLAQILRESSASRGSTTEEMKHAQKGNWFPNVHFAWEVVFGALSIPKRKRATFSQLWKEAVDESLFSLSASNERKYWGFQLFQRYVLKGPASQLPDLFGPNYIRCLNNQLNSKDRSLHLIAEKSVKAILTRSSNDPEAAPLLAKQIMAAEVNFSGVAKTRTLENIFSQAGLDSLEELINLAETVPDVIEGTDDQKRKSCQVLAGALTCAIRSHPIPRPESPDLQRHRNLVNMMLQILVKLAYKEAGSALYGPREEYKSRIASCLTHFIAKDVEDPTYHPYYTLYEIRQSVSPSLKADAEVSRSISRGWTTLEQLHKEITSSSDRGKKTLEAFELLLIFTILRVYDGDGDAVNMLDELQDCYQSFVMDKSSPKVSNDSVILIEIILSFISKPSQLFRRLAFKVFTVYADGVNEEALESFFQVLKTRESMSGQDELFGKEDEDDAEDADVEMVDGDAPDIELDHYEDVNESTSSDDTASKEDDALEEDVDDEELAAFDAKLAQALETLRADDDSKVVEEELSDEDMDDAQMEALDPLIATMFKQREEVNNSKKEKKASKENIVLFKCRVIELLEIFVKQEHLKPLALSVITPLLEVMRATSDKQVSKKAANVVREYMKLYKLRKNNKSNETKENETALAIARELLPTVHAMAMREGSNAYAEACSRASILAVKVIMSSGGTFNEVLQQYLLTEDTWFTQPDCRVRESFFKDWRNWATQARQVGLKATT